MEKIKNIFDYATKELSQDAFLRWLFENWNCEQEDVRQASQSLLKAFLGFDEEQQFNIQEIKTRAQHKKIDVLVECKINNENYVIAIEDKTTSYEHDDQLQGYSMIIKSDGIYHDYKPVFIFYKTYLITEEESNRIKSLNWEIYDIKRIYNVFSKLNYPIHNGLLFDYIEKIKKLHSDLTGTLPIDIKSWNFDQWYNYTLNNDWNLNDIEINFGNYYSLYRHIQFRLKGKNRLLLPYLEIRSRDFSQGFFIIRILMYGIEPELIKENAPIWKDKISKSNLFKVQNQKKQIGSNKIHNQVSTRDELMLLVNQYIDEFRRIME